MYDQTYDKFFVFVERDQVCDPCKDVIFRDVRRSLLSSVHMSYGTDRQLKLVAGSLEAAN